MKELKGDMQTMLSLDDYGYESSDAGETIRSCKSDQRDYDITSHSGMDVMRFYKRLLERYKDALKTEINALYSLKIETERRKEKKEKELAKAVAGGVATGVVTSILFPPAIIFGLGAVAASTAAAVSDLEDVIKELINQRVRYQKRSSVMSEMIEEIERIERKYDLGLLSDEYDSDEECVFL